MKKNVKLIDLSQLIEDYKDNPYQQLGENARTLMGTFSSHEANGFYENAIYMGDHCCTHMDSSIHFNPEGTPVNELPLESIYGEACLLDISHLKPRADVTIEDIKEAQEKAGVDVKDFKIVVLKTGRSKLWGTKEYHWDLLNILPETTEWLIKQGMKLICVDMVTTEIDRVYYGADPETPFWERYPMHGLMRKYEWYMIENMTNLDAIPGSTFTLCAFPLKFKGGSASPVRAVAIIEE